MTKYLVGIDSGGSKTEVLVTDLDGNVLHRSQGNGSNLTTTDLGLSAFTIRENLRLSFETLEPGEIEVLVLGLAGLDTKEEADTSLKVFSEVLSDWQIKNFFVFNDAVLALVNGTTAANAIVLIGGTGSNCLGYNDQEEKAKAGGFNWAVSDDGSGFDAGRLAIRAAIRSTDGRGLKTSLEGLVYNHLHTKTANDLKNQIYKPLINKREVASLAPIVVKAADAGDAVAGAIINYCLDELLLHVLAVTTRLHLLDKKFDLVVAGSFLIHLLPRFREKLSAKLPLAHLVSVDEAPVYGAIKIAQKFLSGRSLRRWTID